MASGDRSQLMGRCLCGAVRYRIHGTPLVMYHCHCQQCRRASGASFATNLLVRSESFELVAGAEALTGFESSPGKRRHFCSRCGSPIFSAAEATPAIRSVRGGTLDGDPGVRPAGHFHVASKSAWFEISDDLPRKSGGLGDA
jgi:hypothetical protein